MWIGAVFEIIILFYIYARIITDKITAGGAGI